MENIPRQSTDLVLQLHIVKHVRSGNRIKLDVAASNFTLFKVSQTIHYFTAVWTEKSAQGSF